MKIDNEFQYLVEQFDDINILRYQVPAFEHLNLKEKTYVYYLSRAALAGRDILWDQNNCWNLRVRQLLETIIRNYSGNRESREFIRFLIYAKKVFFSNGIHHHYSMDKFVPLFSKAYFKSLLVNIGNERAFKEFERILFDPEYMAKRVVLDADKDLLQASATNFYAGVTQEEAEEFYKNQEGRTTHELNSTLIKKDDLIKEEIWRIGGKYTSYLRRIIANLEKASEYASNDQQKKTIALLCDYYRTGDPKTFDTYSIEWLKENGNIDFINGFIEVYGDPLGYKGSWESVVQIVDEAACERTRQLAEQALWFEQNAPIDERFKKIEVSGVTARVVQAAILGGDCHPAPPIGINLPNAEWIREQYGSKSVTLDNIAFAYFMASMTSGFTDEFAYSDQEKQWEKEYSYSAGNTHTDLHECLGHGSGKMLPGVTADALKNYYSTIEEARADLFALYYIMDEKLLEMGIISCSEVAKCEYCSYIRKGLIIQLTRIKPGNNLEESHMRNRQLIASWVYEHGKADNVIEKIERGGKTYFEIQDFNKLRLLFGKLLAEVQRIKSEGDIGAARELIETYGVKIDTALHNEVLKRCKKLNIPPYSGVINPEYRLIEKEGRILDVEIHYPTDFLEQMLRYSEGNPL